MTDSWTYSVELEGESIALPPGRSTVGRSRKCDVSINDASVSRRHVVVTAEGGKLEIEDLGSSNGTFLNGTRLAGSGELGDGDRLGLGDADLTVRIRHTSVGFETVRMPPSMPEAPAPRPKAPEEREPAPAEAGPRAPGEATAYLQQASVELAQDALSLAEVEEREAHVAPPPPAEPSKPASTVPSSGPTAGESSFADLDDFALDEPAEAASVGRPASAPPVPPPAPRPAVPQPAAATPRVAEPAPEPVAPPPAPESPSFASESSASRRPSSAELLPSLDELDAAVGPVPPAPKPASSTTAHHRASAALKAAGFWVRLVAVLLDSLWMGAAVFAVTYYGGQVFGMVASGVTLLVVFIGWSIWGTTPGKRLLGLYVCTVDGQRGIGPLRTIVRLAGYSLSSLIFGIGFLMVAFSEDRRALHDRIAGTYVGRVD